MDDFTREELKELVASWMNGWVEHEGMYEDEYDRSRQHKALDAVLQLIDFEYSETAVEKEDLINRMQIILDRDRKRFLKEENDLPRHNLYKMWYGALSVCEEVLDELFPNCRHYFIPLMEDPTTTGCLIEKSSIGYSYKEKRHG